MTQPFTTDPEQILAGMREWTEQLLEASQRTKLELTAAMQETLAAVADTQEKLAEASDLEWMGRLLRAQATFTRAIGDASAQFARDLLDED
jgi:hypothetical protein